MRYTEMPNFLVGLVLLDKNPATHPQREILRSRISSGIAVTPLGLGSGAPGRTGECDEASDSRRAVAIQLSVWCLNELGFEATPGPDSSRSTDYSKLWNGWVGHEEEIYRACAGLVGRLSPEDVEAICGPETRYAARAVLREFALAS